MKMKTIFEIDNKKWKMSKWTNIENIWNDIKINNESETSKRINKKVLSINRRNHSV